MQWDDGVNGGVFLLSFVDYVGKLINLGDGDGDGDGNGNSGHERSIFGWCGVFEYYSNCVGLGVRSVGWMMCGLGDVLKKSSS